MKLNQIMSAVPSLQKLSSAELSLKSLYKIKKLIDKLETGQPFRRLGKKA